MPNPRLATLNLFPARVPFCEPGTSGLLTREALQTLRNLTRYLEGRDVTLRDFGAVGDGVADDTKALQAAIDQSGVVLGVYGDVYRITTDLLIPSNRVLDFRWSTIKRDFPDGYCLRGLNSGSNGTAADENIVVRNVKFRDMGKADGSDFGAAIRFSWGKDIIIDGVDAYFISTQPTVNLGAWCIYLSGENIQARNIRIHNVAQGEQADGIHCGYLKNCVISDFIIESGDDAIALVVPPQEWTFEGLHEPSEGVVIGNGYVSSPGFAGLRIGAFNNSTAKTHPDSIYRDVLFHDIVVGPVGSAAILLEDRRRDANINLQHDNIVFDNILVAEQTGVFHLIAIFGDHDSSTPAERHTKNWKRVTLSNIKAEQGGTSGSLMRCHSCEELTLRGLDIVQDHGGSPTTAAAMSFSYIDRLLIESSEFRTHTTNNAIAVSFVRETRLLDTFFRDLGNAFRCLSFTYNLDFSMSLIISGGGMYGYQRGIQDDNGVSAPNPLADLILDRADLRGSVAPISGFTATPTGLNIRDLVSRAVASSGTTGGSGSAGAGNQYVELSIGGTTYKVLHDGTV